MKKRAMVEFIAYSSMIIGKFPACRTGWHVAIKKQIIIT
jgi:hypothetical protein